MIKKTLQIGAIAAVIASGISLAATAASAQTVTGYGNTATTTSTATVSSAPVLYNQNGEIVDGYNSTTGTLNPGWYYNASGQPVYYYSNGTYYDYTTGDFGGTAYYPNGTGYSGVLPAYTGVFMTGSSATPVYTAAPTNVTGSGNESGTMITLYNSSGQPVNTVSGTSLPAGYYSTASGDQIYYYGNGTYYDSTTGMYGGSVNDPTGLAGTYYYNAPTPVTTGTYVTPGVPDTGMGGEAGFNLLMLLASGLVFASGAVYLSRSYFLRF